MVGVGQMGFSLVSELSGKSDHQKDILAYMTDQRKTTLEYADNYDYEDYSSSLGGESPYTSYTKEQDKVTEPEEEYTYRDSRDRYKNSSPKTSKMGHRGYNNGYRNADQNAAGTFVVQGGGGGGHSGSGYGGHGGGCGGGYSSTSIGLCEILAVAGLVAVAAAAFGALALALGLGRRKKRSFSRTMHGFEKLNIIEGKFVKFEEGQRAMSAYC